MVTPRAINMRGFTHETASLALHALVALCCCCSGFGVLRPVSGECGLVGPIRNRPMHFTNQHQQCDAWLAESAAPSVFILLALSTHYCWMASYLSPPPPFVHNQCTCRCHGSDRHGLRPPVLIDDRRDKAAPIRLPGMTWPQCVHLV